jgi:hypothetical protein
MENWEPAVGRKRIQECRAAVLYYVIPGVEPASASSSSVIGVMWLRERGRSTNSSQWNHRELETIARCRVPVVPSAGICCSGASHPRAILYFGVLPLLARAQDGCGVPNASADQWSVAAPESIGLVSAARSAKSLGYAGLRFQHNDTGLVN